MLSSIARRARALQHVATTAQTLHHQQARCIASTSVLYKRKGGNSAFVVKNSQFYKKKSLKKKDKLKKDAKPHETHLERTRRLKSVAKTQQYNQELWEQLENDPVFNQEIDQVAAYLNNLGPDGDYIYEPEQTIADLDENDVLDKLNALARGDLGDEKQLAVDDYNFLMKVYAAKGLHKEAHALLCRMEQNLATKTTRQRVFSQPQDDATTTSLDLASSLESVPHTLPPNTLTYMYYICALTDSKQAAMAVRTLGRMKELGIVPDVQTYNSVMNVCAKSQKLQWAYNIMEKMQMAGLVPNSASFTILMHAAIAENDIDKAFETFHLMRSHVTDPDVVSFTTLIHGFAKIGRVERALNLMEDLLECGLTPTQVTFNSLINACAKSHHFAHKAIEFYYEMQELYDYLPNMYTYNTVLHACAKNGDIVTAQQIMNHMHKHQVPMDQVTYNTLLNVYARAQIKAIVSKAPRNKKPLPPPEEIHQEPLEWDDQGNPIDLTRPFKDVYSMENWNYDGRFEESSEEDDDLDDDEVMAEEPMTADELKELEAIKDADEQAMEDEFDQKPMDLSNFGKFQTQNIKQAERIYQEMLDNHVTPSSVTLNSMLSVYANALRLRSAETFLREQFTAHEIEPTHYTYRTLMQMYTRAKRTHEAEALMEEVVARLEEGDIEKDPVTFGLLVDHYAKQQQLRPALECLELADGHGIQIPKNSSRKSAN